MSRKIKKNGVMTGVLLIAFILTGLTVGFTACQYGMTESLPVPLVLPVAIITGSDHDDTSSFIGNYSFALDWKRPDGPLYPDAEYPLDSPQSIVALKEALATWQVYCDATDPRPGYKKSGQAKVQSGIFQSGKLDNSAAAIAANGSIIIPRYWPQSYQDHGQHLPVTPTVETWRSNHHQREEDFKKAEASVQKMIDAIKASPFYEVEDNGTFPLKELALSMQAYITYPTSVGLVDRQEFDIPSGGTGPGWIDPTKSGPLYEYYFGFIPPNDDTWYLDGSGPFAF